MENNNIIVPLAISIVYLLSKFIEMKFIVKENKPLKDIFRDALIVYISSVLGMYGMEQLDTSIAASKNTSVFIGNPDF
jgi:hypothetical protein